MDLERRQAIQRHYDRLAFLYRMLWGEHLHHGFWAEGSEDTPARAQLRLNEELARLAELSPSRGRRALDVGCGIGGSSFWLAENFDYEVLGINISPVQLRMARHSSEYGAGAGRTRFVRMDAERMRLPDHAFDLVWAIESSEHFADRPAFLAKCFRLLRPGGTLALCSWLGASPGLDADPGMLVFPLASRDQMLRWLAEAGFGTLRSRDVSRNVSRTWDFCGRIAKRPAIRSVAGMLGSEVVSFVDSFEWMRASFADGTLRYGMFAARKAPGTKAAA